MRVENGRVTALDLDEVNLHEDGVLALTPIGEQRLDEVDGPLGALALRECCCCGKRFYGPPFFGVRSRKPTACSDQCAADCARDRMRLYMREYREKHRTPPEPRYATCTQCGEVFETMRSDAKFCGATCRQRASRARA